MSLEGPRSAKIIAPANYRREEPAPKAANDSASTSNDIYIPQQHVAAADTRFPRKPYDEEEDHVQNTPRILQERIAEQFSNEIEEGSPEDSLVTRLSRRGFFKTTVGAGLISAGLASHLGFKKGFEALSENMTHEERIEALIEKTRVIRQETHGIVPLERTFATGPLEGKQLGNSLVAMYFGVEGRVDRSSPSTDTHGAVHYPFLPLPAEITVRFDETLQHLLDKKQHGHPNEYNRRVGEYHAAVYKKLLSEGKEGKTTLSEKMLEASQESVDIRSKLNWDEVGKLYGLNAAGTQVLQALSERITGDTLLAYSTNEIISSGLGATTDVEAYDALFRTAGEAFVTRAPALYDGQESYGPYQLTPYAIYKGPVKGSKPDRNGNYPMEYRGASKMNRALPTEDQIPNDIIELTTMRDHSRAAYLFALHNLADIIHVLSPVHATSQLPHTNRNMNATEKRAAKEGLEKAVHARQLLEQLYTMPENALLEFIATSHHLPGPSRSALVEYLNTKQAIPYSHYCAQKTNPHTGQSWKLDTYAKNATEHRAALQNFTIASNSNTRTNTA